MQELSAIIASFSDRFLPLFLLGLLFFVFYRYRKFVKERSDALINIPSRRSPKKLDEDKIIIERRKNANLNKNNQDRSDIE